MKTLALLIRKYAQLAPGYWESKLLEYGIKSHSQQLDKPLDPIILRQVYQILSLMPTQMVKDCKVKDLYIDTEMGPSLPYFPNHGFFMPSNQSVTLNSNIFDAPDYPADFTDERGYTVSRGAQTVLHEFGHSLEAELGNISLKPNWINLSGWSETSKPGLKKLIINEAGKPPLIGEWFYNPKAGFTRFYGKRAPYEDWADCFSFFSAGLRNKLPENKQKYFQNLFSKYSN